MDKLRFFEYWGIYVSIIFVRNTSVFLADRKPMWRFKIDGLDETLFESCPYSDYDECCRFAFEKAAGTFNKPSV
jgi:hypothetical protein